MAVSHVKSDTIGDFTGTITGFNSQGSTTTIAATDLVRPVDWNSAHNQFYSLTGNTTGNSTASGTNVLFAGSGGISVGGSTGTVIISGPAPVTLTRWQNFNLHVGRTDSAVQFQNRASSDGTMYFCPLVIDGGPFPGHMTINSMFINVSGSHTNAVASTAAKTLHFSFGIYTISASSTLNLLNSANGSVTAAGGANQSASFNGPRFVSIVSSQWSVQPVLTPGGDYYLGYVFRSSGEALAGFNWQCLGAASGQMSGTMGSSAATATSMGLHPFLGQFSVSTAALPATVNQNALVKTASVQLMVPRFVFENQVSNF